MIEIGDWKRILWNDLPATFLLEVMLRTLIMFIIILITLRASGKRGIKQLSIFELVLIIGLGSAAGDPMFYEDVGILPAFTVFTIVIFLYIGITSLSDRIPWIEKILEGKPTYIIKEGRILLEAFKQASLSQDELFAALRCRNVEHLGQIEILLIETSGEFSLLFYEDKDVKDGLPIFPDQLEMKTNTVKTAGYFACCTCGYVNHFKSAGTCPCPICSCKEWIPASNRKRIT